MTPSRPFNDQRVSALNHDRRGRQRMSHSATRSARGTHRLIAAGVVATALHCQEKSLNKPSKSIACVEADKGTIPDVREETSRWVAAAGDGDIYVNYAVTGQRQISTSQAATVPNYFTNRYSAAGEKKGSGFTPAGPAPGANAAPDYAGEFLVSSILNCQNSFVVFQLLPDGTERVRGTVSGYNAVREAALDAANAAYVIATVKVDEAGTVVIDSQNLKIVKNSYDANYEDTILKLTADGKVAWKYRLTETDRIGGAFGVAHHAGSSSVIVTGGKAGFAGAAGNSVVTAFDDASGAVRWQTDLAPDVRWHGQKLGRDGYVYVFGEARLPRPSSPGDSDVNMAIAKLSASDGSARMWIVGTSADDEVLDVAADSGGTLVVAGAAGGTLPVFGGTSSTATGFIHTYAPGPGGELVLGWNTPLSVAGGGIAATGVDVLAGGVSEGVVVAATATGSYAGQPFGGTSDMVVLRLNAAGGVQWVSQGCACSETINK